MSRQKYSDSELELVAKIRAMDETEREFCSLMIYVMADLRNRPDEKAMFSRWMKISRRTKRPASELLHTLRTGAWRDEVRKAERHRVLKITGAR